VQDKSLNPLNPQEQDFFGDFLSKNSEELNWKTGNQQTTVKPLEVVPDSKNIFGENLRMKSELDSSNMDISNKSINTTADPTNMALLKMLYDKVEKEYLEMQARQQQQQQMQFGQSIPKSTNTIESATGSYIDLDKGIPQKSDLLNQSSISNISDKPGDISSYPTFNFPTSFTDLGMSMNNLSISTSNPQGRDPLTTDVQPESFPQFSNIINKPNQSNEFQNIDLKDLTDPNKLTQLYQNLSVYLGTSLILKVSRINFIKVWTTVILMPTGPLSST